jgi:hypothetical protein
MIFERLARGSECNLKVWQWENSGRIQVEQADYPAIQKNLINIVRSRP